MMKPRLSLVLGVALLVTMFAPVARADELIDPLIDPPLLWVTALGTSSGGGNPNLIGTNGFRLTFHSDGAAHQVLDPVLLILGLPGTSGFTPPSIDTSTSSYPAGTFTAVLGGTNQYGSWNTTTGFANLLDTSGQDAYARIGLGNSPAAETYDAWNAETGLTSWGLFVYTLTFNPDFAAPNYIDIMFSSPLSAGTFAIAYAQKLNAQGNPCTVPGCTYSTEFNNAGLVTVVPEPGSLLLLGTGLLVAARGLRKRSGTRT